MNKYLFQFFITILFCACVTVQSRSQKILPSNTLGAFYLNGDLEEEYKTVLQQLKETELQDSSPIELIIPLMNAGKISMFLEKYKRANKYLEKVLKIIEDNTGWLYPDYGIALNFYIYSKLKLNELDDIEFLLKEVNTIHEKSIGKDNISYANLLFNEAIYAYKMNQFEVAEAKVLEAITMSKELTTEAEYYGRYLFMELYLNKLYFKTSRENIALQNLNILKDKLEEIHLDNTFIYSKTILFIGNAHFAKEEFIESEKAYEEYEKVIDKILPNHPEFYGDVYSRRSAILMYTSRYNECIPFLQKTLEQYDEDTNEDKRNRIKVKLAYCYFALGMYDKLDVLLDKIENIRFENTEYNTLLHIVRTERAMVAGQYIKAEINLSKIPNPLLTGKKYLTFDDQLALQLNIRLTILLGRLNKAKVLIEQWKEYLATSKSSNQKFYVNIELLEVFSLLTSNNYKEVIQKLESISSDNPQITPYENFVKHLFLGHAYYANRDTLKAKSTFEKALTIADKIQYTEQHIDILKVKTYLLNIEVAEGNYEGIEKKYKKILDKVEVNNITYSKVLSDIAYCYAAQNKWELAFQTISKALENRKQLYYSYFASASEVDKRLYLRKTKYAFDIFYDLLLRANPDIQDKFVALAYNIQLMNYHFYWQDAQKQNIKLYNFQHDRRSHHYPSYLTQLNLMKSRIATFKFASDENKSKYKKEWIETDLRTGNLEKTLLRAAAHFEEEKEEALFKWSDIKNALKEDEVVVEIVKAQLYETSQEAHYFALLLSRNSSSPQFIPLENTDLLEKEGYALYLTQMTSRRSLVLMKEDEHDTYDLYWKPIQQEIDKLQRKPNKIFLVNDGVYRLININTLKNTKTDQYVLETHSIVPLVSSAKLLQNNTLTFKEKTAVLFGNPNFDKKEDDVRGVHSNFKISSLPGTQKEVDKVGAILKNDNWNVKVYTQENATESNIKNFKSSPEILHIATHGFFFKQTSNNNINSSLFQSGLILSEVNSKPFSEKFKEGNDGILSAYEVLNLNLSQTKLLVLSACKTGITNSFEDEEVLGLQFAFHTAGVKSMIMSLWDVDDFATQKLMNDFYTNFIGGQSKNEAFRKAQLNMLEEYGSPYFWGAFTITN
ncbi:CHAT domain-containing protein [Flammeovirga aprica]|uniref:CHAT domain-containing protein n=1 Tax=Flammeovirga aprica JL-4 TaxID=694437 RepID=A0A7X9XAG3_9BACT|nr:CHAT domain-containing protein [Flammeovirga aprica]NME69626.1 CHAT domain-containing protein [Flammeovirga aprica JL-4]